MLSNIAMAQSGTGGAYHPNLFHPTHILIGKGAGFGAGNLMNTTPFRALHQQGGASTVHQILVRRALRGIHRSLFGKGGAAGSCGCSGSGSGSGGSGSTGSGYKRRRYGGVLGENGEELPEDGDNNNDLDADPDHMEGVDGGPDDVPPGPDPVVPPPPPLPQPGDQFRGMHSESQLAYGGRGVKMNLNTPQLSVNRRLI